MANGVASVWNTDRIETLTRMAAEGHSSRAIGRELGVSRNSVIGKADRLGLAIKRHPKEERESRPPRERRPRREPAGTGSQAKPFVRAPWAPQPRVARPLDGKERAPSEATTSTAITIIDLTMDTCRWPLWANTDSDRYYCGEPVVEGSPYCSRHTHMAWARKC